VGEEAAPGDEEPAAWPFVDAIVMSRKINNCKMTMSKADMNLRSSELYPKQKLP